MLKKYLGRLVEWASRHTDKRVVLVGHDAVGVFLDGNGIQTIAPTRIESEETTLNCILIQSALISWRECDSNPSLFGTIVAAAIELGESFESARTIAGSICNSLEDPTDVQS